MYDALELLKTYEYIVEIRNFNFATDRWQQDFIHACCKYSSYTFESFRRNVFATKDTFVKYDGWMDIADYRFIPSDEIAFPPAKPEFECPFGSTLFGYFCFRLNNPPRPGWVGCEHREFLLAVFRKSMGLFITSDRERQRLDYISCLNLGRYPALYLDKFDLDDGDTLLSRDNESYIDYVLDRVRHSYAERGLAGNIFALEGTCHNPIRLCEDRDDLGQPVKQVYDLQGNICPAAMLGELMRDADFEIWVYDFANLNIICEKSLTEISIEFEGFSAMTDL